MPSTGEAARERWKITSISMALAGACVAVLLAWLVIEPLAGGSNRDLGDLLVALVVAAGSFSAAWLGRSANIAVERQCRDQQAEMARRDPLTGLYNYLYLHERLPLETAAARRDGTACAVIMLDLNDFGDVNERFGHAAGDATLAAIGRALAEQVAEPGVAVRYGGDKFAVVVPGAHRAEAERVAARAASAIAEASVRATPLNRHRRVTASHGSAVYPLDGADTESLITAAHRSMHEARASLVPVRERTDERHAQDVFFALGQAMGDSLDPQERVQNVVEAVGKSLDLDGCSIALVLPDETIEISAYYASRDELIGPFSEIKQPMTREEAQGLGLLSGRIAYADDVSDTGMLPERYRRILPAGSWLMTVPLPEPFAGFMTLMAAHERCAPPSTGLAAAISKLAIAALRSSHLYGRTKRQGDELSALAGVGGLLFGEGDFEERLGAVVRSIVEVTGYDMVTLDTADPTGERPFFRNFFGRSPDGAPIDESLSTLWRSLRPALTEPSVAHFLSQISEPVLMDDPLNEVPEFYRESIARSGTRSVVVMPITWRGVLKGLMYFASYREHAFDEQDVAMMRTIAAQLAPSIEVATLHYELETSYSELKEAHLQAILRLAYAAEARDPYTGRHLHRIKAFSDALGRHMGLDDDQREALGYGAVVHDLGKLRIPDSILIKVGELSDDEWRVMKRHPEYGAELLGTSAFYDIARQVAMHHHERWDGSGYPLGLRGDEIPLAARIVSVADVYDALTSDRPYKVAWPPERAIAELLQLRGKHLCPESVDAFLRLWNDGVIARIEEETGAHGSFEFDFRERYAA